jgi:hypothetical protein
MQADKLFLAGAALLGTLGGFPRPSDRYQDIINNSVVVEFVQVFVLVWLFTVDVGISITSSILWMILLKVLIPFDPEDGTIPALRGNITSTDQAGFGGVVHIKE